MNNLHRELAPISDAAWAGIDAEAQRTFTLHVAGRRVVDVTGPAGSALAAVATGHLDDLKSPGEDVTARLRGAQQLVELRVPFTVSREAVDAVERGAKDPDWDPVKDAARKMAVAEDRIIFEGYPAAGIAGIRKSSSNTELELPTNALAYPDVVSQAVSTLRLAGVGGPYSLLLSANAYTAVNETSDQGYPVAAHLARVIDGQIVWAPAIDGAFMLSTRGGDFELTLGQDLSIGYLSHDATSVELYFVQTLASQTYTSEAVVALTPPSATRA